MSFAFAAIGTKDEAIAQLKHASISTGPDRFNEFGTDLRDLLVKHFGQEAASAGAGHEYRYVVKANGHGGGNAALSLQLTVEPQWTAVPPAEPEAADEVADELEAQRPDLTAD